MCGQTHVIVRDTMVPVVLVIKAPAAGLTMAPVVLHIPDPVVLVMRDPVVQGTMLPVVGNMQGPVVPNTMAPAAKPTMVPVALRIPAREEHVTQAPVGHVTQARAEQERVVLQYVNNQHTTLHEKISRLERPKCLYRIFVVVIAYWLWTNRPSCKNAT